MARGTTGYRVGLGVDAHPVAAGRACRIGGVTIPCEVGPVGHSDGDPLLHALADALLGAIGAGDIGQHFPDSDPAWAGADSRAFVSAAVALVRAAGRVVANADVVVTADRPKLAPHRDAIRASVAACLGVSVDCVNVKGKTRQGAPPGPEVVSAQVVVLLEPAPAARAPSTRAAKGRVARKRKR